MLPAYDILGRFSILPALVNMLYATRSWIHFALVSLSGVGRNLQMLNLLKVWLPYKFFFKNNIYISPSVSRAVCPNKYLLNHCVWNACEKAYHFTIKQFLFYGCSGLHFSTCIISFDEECPGDICTHQSFVCRRTWEHGRATQPSWSQSLLLDTSIFSAKAPPEWTGL